jgi:hypothetical protein
MLGNEKLGTTRISRVGARREREGFATFTHNPGGESRRKEIFLFGFAVTH